MKSLVILLFAILLSVVFAKVQDQQCNRNNGVCVPPKYVKQSCTKLKYDCGSSAVCCREKTNRQVKSKRRKCRKTPQRCKKEGGTCVKTKKNGCPTVTIDSLCKGASCTCCLGNNERCGSSLACSENGGFCINKRKESFCERGIIDETLCEGRKCACCTIIEPVPDSNCTCGQANEVRIVGGEEVTPQNKYPWQVGIMTPLADSYSCGGSLISDRYVITAAQCLFDPFSGKLLPVDDIQIGLADHSQFSVNDDIEGVTRKVDIERYKVHENYDPSELDEDIAVIKLKEPLDLTANREIKPVCLPKNKAETYEGFDGIVSGWGLQDNDNFTSIADTLREVSIPILSPECEGDLPDLIEITDNKLCAGTVEGGKDACIGDAGSPLVVKEGDTHTLVGIVSLGVGCADPNVPGVYTRVTQYLDWIDQNTRGSSYCSE